MDNRLIQLGPKLFAGIGVALLVLAAYMAGQDELHCDRANGRVDCVVTECRWLGHATLGRRPIADVVQVGVRSSTSSTTWETGSGNLATTTTTNDVLVLHTRDGRDADSLGGDRSGEFADTVSALINPAPALASTGDTTTSTEDITTSTEDSMTRVDISDSYWPVATACGGMGLFFFAFGATAFYVQRKEGA